MLNSLCDKGEIRPIDIFCMINNYCFHRSHPKSISHAVFTSRSSFLPQIITSLHELFQCLEVQWMYHEDVVREFRTSRQSLDILEE